VLNLHFQNSYGRRAVITINSLPTTEARIKNPIFDVKTLFDSLKSFNCILGTAWLNVEL
jgi:hypothetical protein